ncbi:hypothetical protein D1007_42009 [Hordeum vulgare]|nr:hypothetical protein D1007_42009 [Hordeum vulgare]
MASISKEPPERRAKAPGAGRPAASQHGSGLCGAARRSAATRGGIPDLDAAAVRGQRRGCLWLPPGGAAAGPPVGHIARRQACLVLLELGSSQEFERPEEGEDGAGGHLEVPVEAAAGKMVGSKQPFSFITKDGVRGGFIMYEFVLPAQAGRLAGGDELALSKIFPTPRVNNKYKDKRSSAPAPATSSPPHQRPASTRRSGDASSPPPLRQAPATSSPPHQRPASTRRRGDGSSPPPLRQAPATSSAPHQRPASTRRSGAGSSPPPLRQAPASFLVCAPCLRQRQVLATSPRPPSSPSARALRQGPGTSAPSSPPSFRQGHPTHAPSPRQGSPKRVLLLEVGDSSPREGKSFSCQPVYNAMELLASGRRLSIDCTDMFLLDSGKSKRQRTAAEF